MTAHDPQVPAARPALPPRPSTTTRGAAAGDPADAPTRVAAPQRLTPAAKAKPDPRPTRLGVGAGAIAAMSIMAAGLIRFPVADPTFAADDLSAQAAPSANVRVERRVRYVQLKPGEKAPKGAKVIDAAAPTPRVVVRTIQAVPAPKARKTRTRQSGKG